jgi:hypothetical protein
MDKSKQIDKNQNLRDVRFLIFDTSKLSDDEIRFLETYHLMIEDQEEFVKNIAPISYECILEDEDEDYSTWKFKEWGRKSE